MHKPTEVILYARYSTGEQSKGSTLVRQFGNMRERMGRYSDIVGDAPVREISDRGLSGFHGVHRRRGNFGHFEREVLAGMHPNALLVAENLDRLSREEQMIARRLLEDIVKAGCGVYLLDGGYYQPFTNLTVEQTIMAAVVAERARNESKAKSDRTIANWQIRRAKSLDRGLAMSAKVCPPWLSVVDDRYALNEAKLAYIWQMFDLADQGLGSTEILTFMNANMPKPHDWSNTKRKNLTSYWQRREIVSTLRDRRLIGERQDRRTEMNPETGTARHLISGEPVPGFYPVAIDPAIFERVVRAAEPRKAARGGGKSKAVVNLLSGLIRCAWLLFQGVHLLHDRSPKGDGRVRHESVGALS